MENSWLDQTGKQVTLQQPARRIISLVPSQTELLHDLGLTDEVVGITKFCVHPEQWQKTKPNIGGTKAFWFDKIESLNPDLIIGNKEENYKEGIDQLSTRYPVWISDIISLQDATGMIQSVGEMTGRTKASLDIIEKIRLSFSGLKPRPRKKTLYLIWRKPWMGVGHQTFIHSMMAAMGLENVLSDVRYPELGPGDIQSLAPEIVFLSSEPFPFTEEHAQEIQNLLPHSKVLLVDGEMFSWYGSRLILAPDYFNSLEF